MRLILSGFGIVLLAACGRAEDAAYVFTLDGKPFRPRVISLRGDPEHPQSGDLIWMSRMLLTLGSETRHAPGLKPLPEEGKMARLQEWFKQHGEEYLKQLPPALR